MAKGDNELENEDWLRRSWRLPPYKSDEFMEVLTVMGISLAGFRKLPVYKSAVAKGLIIDDEWVGQ